MLEPEEKFSTDQILVCENDIYFNGPINTISMSKLSNEIVKLESKLLKEERKLRRKIEEVIRGDKELSSQIYDNTSEFCEIEIKVTNKPIRLFITSNGGSVHQALMVYDLIRGLRIPVHTICRGYVASAGTILSLAGKKRFITTNSYMLIHQLSAGSWGKFSSMTDQYENAKTLMEHIKSIYIENTNLNSSDLDEILKHDISWPAKICLEKGLIQEII
jgi:ATP-dependent protease ClpP protease subunit